MIDYNQYDFQTPIYICELAALRKNLILLESIKQRSGATILLALKGFAMHSTFSLVAQYLDGCTASGLHEATLAHHTFLDALGQPKAVHTYSVAFKEQEIDAIAQISSHIVFNSVAQLLRFHARAKAVNPDIHCALRLNPETSAAPVDLYNPCAPYSRLGVTLEVLEQTPRASWLPYVDGLNFHALCEEGADALDLVLQAFEARFSDLFTSISYVNFGGGHHITKTGYDVERLIAIIQAFKAKYPHIEVILEPGEAIGWQSGVLVATVLDIVHNSMDIAILDASAEAHMPDTLAMPYRADVRFSAQPGEKPYTYRLAGNTCLAGDIMGDYSFDAPLNIGDRIIFEDQIHYTFVKNTTFNGMALPSLGIIDEQDMFSLVKEFGYEAYASRLS